MIETWIIGILAFLALINLIIGVTDKDAHLNLVMGILGIFIIFRFI